MSSDLIFFLVILAIFYVTNGLEREARKTFPYQTTTARTTSDQDLDGSQAIIIFQPQTITLSKGNLVGTISNPPNQNIISFTLHPFGPISEYSDIIRVTSNNQYCCYNHYGSRIPDILFERSSTSKLLYVHDQTNHVNRHVRNIDAGIIKDEDNRIKVVSSLTGVVLYVNNVPKVSFPSSLKYRPPRQELRVYASDRFRPAADAKISDLTFSRITYAPEIIDDVAEDGVKVLYIRPFYLDESDGQYFYFNKTMWETKIGSLTNDESGTVFPVNQIRDRSVIWTGGVKIFDSPDCGVYGSRISNSGPQQWQVGDVLTKFTCESPCKAIIINNGKKNGLYPLYSTYNKNIGTPGAGGDGEYLALRANDQSTNTGKHEGFCFDGNIGKGDFEWKIIWKNNYVGWPKAQWSEISVNGRNSQVAFGGGCGCAWRDGDLFSRYTGKGNGKWDKFGSTNSMVQNNKKETVILKRVGNRVQFIVNEIIKMNESASNLDIRNICLRPSSSTFRVYYMEVKW